MIKYICFSFIISILLNQAVAQTNLPPGTYTSVNKKAIRFYEEGKKNYETRQDVEAEKFLNKAITEDVNFVEAHSALAYLLMEKGKTKDAIAHFQKAIDINPKFFPRNFYDLALAQLIISNYDDATKNLEFYLSSDRINPSLKQVAEKFLKNAKFGSQAIKHPTPFKPINLGPGINTNDYEYFPAITADGNTFMFTRNVRLGEGINAPQQEDFFISKKNNQVWQTANPILSVNTRGNEGAPTLSADGQYMFFASCVEMDGTYGSPDRKGYGSCDIFYSQKLNGKWTKPQNAGPIINTRNWETQPSFSSDVKTLYFIRGQITRVANKNPDIYSSTIGEDGAFKEPIKLSDNINTLEDEESVYIHPDNQTLYFSSEGHPGMGGKDIYISKKQADGSWGKATNLGYPINTASNENSLLVNDGGKLAYFASEREGGFG